MLVVGPAAFRGSAALATRGERGNFGRSGDGVELSWAGVGFRTDPIRVGGNAAPRLELALYLDVAYASRLVPRIRKGRLAASRLGARNPSLRPAACNTIVLASGSASTPEPPWICVRPQLMPSFKNPLPACGAVLGGSGDRARSRCVWTFGPRYGGASRGRPAQSADSAHKRPRTDNWQSRTAPCAVLLLR